jgi:hypothetical protein
LLVEEHAWRQPANRAIDSQREQFASSKIPKHLAEKMQLSAPQIVVAALLACVAVGHAVIVERGESRSKQHFTKIPRRLKVSSHVFEERFILGSRFGDHTSIVRSPYPRLRFYSFCVQEEAAADTDFFIPSCQYFTLASVSLSLSSTHSLVLIISHYFCLPRT